MRDCEHQPSDPAPECGEYEALTALGSPAKYGWRAAAVAAAGADMAADTDRRLLTPGANEKPLARRPHHPKGDIPPSGKRRISSRRHTVPHGGVVAHLFHLPIWRRALVETGRAASFRKARPQETAPQKAARPAWGVPRAGCRRRSSMALPPGLTCNAAYPQMFSAPHLCGGERNGPTKGALPGGLAARGGEERPP